MHGRQDVQSGLRDGEDLCRRAMQHNTLNLIADIRSGSLPRAGIALWISNCCSASQCWLLHTLVGTYFKTLVVSLPLLVPSLVYFA